MVIRTVKVSCYSVKIHIAMRFLGTSRSDGPGGNNAPSSVIGGVAVSSRGVSSTVRDVSGALNGLPVVSRGHIVVFKGRTTGTNINGTLSCFIQGSSGHTAICITITRRATKRVLHTRVKRHIVPTGRLSGMLSSSGCGSMATRETFCRFIGNIASGASSTFLPVVTVRRGRGSSSNNRSNLGSSTEPIIEKTTLFGNSGVRGILPRRGIPTLLVLYGSFGGNSLATILSSKAHINILLAGSGAGVGASIGGKYPDFSVSISYITSYARASGVVGRTFAPRITRGVGATLRGTIQEGVSSAMGGYFARFGGSPFKFSGEMGETSTRCCETRSSG